MVLSLYNSNTSTLLVNLALTVFFCSLFQPSKNTILQETVRREALNGVYDIDIVKVVTPAVQVGLVCDRFVTV